MSNRRSYGSGYGGGGFNQSNRSSFGLSSGSGSGVNPWQSGNAPGRGSGTGVNPTSLFSSSNLLSSLPADSQIALATKLLTSILPVQQNVQQPPSLLSLNNSYGGNSNLRYGSNFSNDRFRRDDRRDYRNRRPGNDRTKDKSGDNKGRSDSRPKSKPRDDKNRSKNEDEDKKGDSSEEKIEDVSTENIKDEEDIDEKKEKDKEEGPVPGYENIPQKLFHCHVCNKSMWNDVSYDTHVKGRNHRMKLRDLEEDYQVQTDLMRQIAAIQLKLNEFKKGGKRRPYPDQYCKMCDLHFNGMSMFAHRSTDEHQTLKRFIHPTCDVCRKDFQVRIEYDEHLLCVQHLQNEARILLRKEKFEKDPKARLLKDNEALGTNISTEAAEVGEKGEVVLTEEDEILIKNYLDDKTTLPEYDPDSDTLLGIENIVPSDGFYCKICRLFMLNNAVVDTHCRTLKHYKKFVQVLKDEATKKQKEEDAEKRKTDGSDTDNKTKRRKLDVKKDVNGDDKYDPEDESMEDFTTETFQADAIKTEENKDESSTASVTEPSPNDDDDKPKRVQTARRGSRRGGRR